MTSEENEIQLLSLLRDMEALEEKFPNIKTQKLNIFEAVGLDRQEIRHSKVLSFLLSPNEPHGLDDKFFKKLICNKEIAELYQNLSAEFSPSPLKMALDDFDDLLVRREDMHIDILMWSPKNKVLVAIENKVGATESKDQLSRYQNGIANDLRFEGYKKIFLYLTPEGDSATVNAWISVSYKFVADTLETMLNENNNIDNEITILIAHYIDLIRKHVMEEVDQEFVAACEKIYKKHKLIFETVLKTIDRDGSANEAIKMFIQQHNLKVNNSNSRWLSFSTQDIYERLPDVKLSRTWEKQNKPLLFFFELKSDRIKLVLMVGPIEDKDLRSRLIWALNKKINNHEKPASDAFWTTIWGNVARFENVDLEDMNAENILVKMNGLFDQLKNKNVIGTVNEVISEVFLSSEDIS